MRIPRWLALGASTLLDVLTSQTQLNQAQADLNAAEAKLAVSEACTNVLKHASGDDDEYEVRVQISPEQCRIEVADRGTFHTRVILGEPGDVALVRTGNGRYWSDPERYLAGPGMDSSASRIASRDPRRHFQPSARIRLVFRRITGTSPFQPRFPPVKVYATLSIFRLRTTRSAISPTVI